MKDKIGEYLNEVKELNASNTGQLEAFRIRFAGKKGVLTELFAAMKDIEADRKKEYGAEVNQLKNAVEENTTTQRVFGGIEEEKMAMQI